jgi:hypothetical protein
VAQRRPIAIVRHSGCEGRPSIQDGRPAAICWHTFSYPNLFGKESLQPNDQFLCPLYCGFKPEDKRINLSLVAVSAG